MISFFRGLLNSFKLNKAMQLKLFLLKDESFKKDKIEKERNSNL
jgi:hypothetical protein